MDTTMSGQMTPQMAEEQMTELLVLERLVAECLPYLLLVMRPEPGKPPLVPGHLDQIANIWWEELLKDEPDHRTKSAILKDRATTLIFAFATWMWENVEAST
ncbi:hypothetical protein KJ359_011592 [Pestalotiopsis sp. 9143b]|nr:hypothetical protein KJ359_011592 [Pestalotiopsis sp. 9143b]